MIIRMTHPQHGEMDVYSDAEVLANAKNGWSVSKIETAKTEILIEQTAEEKSLAERYEAKFGRKPHHRMAQATIEAALKD